MAVPGLALTNHRSRLHVECRKQGRGAVALVIMGHRPAFPGLHRQAGLAPVQCLDLAFFVDGKYDGLLRWIQVEAHDIAFMPCGCNFSANSGAVRHLEAGVSVCAPARCHAPPSGKCRPAAPSHDNSTAWRQPVCRSMSRPELLGLCPSAATVSATDGSCLS